MGSPESMASRMVRAEGFEKGRLNKDAPPVGDEPVHLTGLAFLHAGEPAHTAVEVQLFDEGVGFLDLFLLLPVMGFLDPGGAGGKDEVAVFPQFRVPRRRLR